MIHQIDLSTPPAFLADVETIYTDLDGTMFAKGGTFFTDDSGMPSIEGPRALQALREAGVEVVIATGRNRAQTAEISRILNIPVFIGELGGFTSYSKGQERNQNANPGKSLIFDRGDWEELPEGKVPVEVMEESGMIDRLCAMYPGMCERVPLTITNAREVTRLMQGKIDVDEATAALTTSERPVKLVDNGEIFPTRHSLDMERGIHIYHVMPTGISKGKAIAADIERRGKDVTTTLAVGDSCADLSMASACGHFMLMGNGLAVPEVTAMIEDRDLDVWTVTGSRIDGWVQMADAILRAKELSS